MLKFLNSASLEDWESRNPTKGSNSVSASFYLDPAEIKAQCREAIDNLNEVSSKTINVEHKLDEFINNSELESKAFDALKQQIADYKTVLQSIRSLIKYNIGEYKTLMSSVGDKVLDGDKILKGQEYARNSIKAYEDRAKRCRENAVTCAVITPFAESQNQIAGHYDHLANNHRMMLKYWEEKEQAYYDIENATKDLFSTGDSTAEQINAALSDLGKSFRAGAFHPNLAASWRAKLKEESKELDVIVLYGIKRPISIDDETWEKYQGEVTTNVLLLEKQGWAVDGIKAYARYINKNIAGKITPGDVLVEIDKCNKQTQLVGSEVFKKMWYAWKAEGLSASESKKKLKMLMKVTGMDGIDENSSAEELRRIANKIDPNLEPDDKFWRSLAGTVETAYYSPPKTNFNGVAFEVDKAVKGIYSQNEMTGTLGKRVHLFRYVISYQQAEYIRNKYTDGTDEEKLIRYLKESGHDDWTADESARLHLKINRKSKLYPNGHSYANGGVNIKVVTNGKFHSEFIINGDGKFLTLLDKDATQDAKVNCSSFNYARQNDYIHQVLDVNPAGEKYKYEPIFRGESLYVHDKNGCRVYSSDGYELKFEPPAIKDMSQYKDDINVRQEYFRKRVKL